MGLVSVPNDIRGYFDVHEYLIERFAHIDAPIRMRSHNAGFRVEPDTDTQWSTGQISNALEINDTWNGEYLAEHGITIECAGAPVGAGISYGNFQLPSQCRPAAGVYDAALRQRFGTYTDDPYYGEDVRQRDTADLTDHCDAVIPVDTYRRAADPQPIGLVGVTGRTVYCGLTTNHVRYFALYGYAKHIDALIEAIEVSSDPEAAERFRQARMAAAQERFLTHLQHRANARTDTLRAEIELNARRLADHEGAVVNTLSALRSSRAELDAIEATTATEITPEAAEQMWDTMTRNVYVDAVTFPTDTSMVVRTTPIPLESPEVSGDTRDLGPFSVEFDFTHGGVSANNLGNRHGEWDHPHIRMGGFCLGDQSRTVQQMIQERDVPGAVGYVIECLQMVNPGDDWGRNWRRWFDDDIDPDDEVIE